MFGSFLVKPVREIISGEAPLGIACFAQRKPRFDHEYHHHPEIEITSIRSSDGQYLIGDATGAFRAGDLYVLGPDLPHRFKNWADGVARSRVLQFRADVFGPDFFEPDAFAGIRRLFARASRGVRLRGAQAGRASRKMDRVFQHRARPRGVGELLGLLELLSETEATETLCGPGYSPDPKRSMSRRLARALAHIDTHWQTPLRLETVARVAALHPQSLSRLFRRHLGLTFQAYLIQIRVSHAARRLIESDAGVTEIALASGFDNMANFHRHFKRAYGTSPLRYRRRFQ